MSLKVVNWNVKWATPRSRRTAEIRKRIKEHAPDVICLTETDIGLLPDGGHVIASGPDYGYPITEGRRKAVLWSKTLWKQTDGIGNAILPPGRFVSGTTQTSVGKVMIIGVCIPWADARVKGANVKREKWEDHQQYLECLREVLDRAPEKRLIVMGDFNQQLPRSRYTRADVHESLLSVIASRLTIATAGIGFRGKRTIDHIALTKDLMAESLGVISNVDGTTMLSDHFGVVADVSVKLS
jgi:endonuclease/exonuclease/phosphatase family metal-dependent hydrolase